MIDISADQIRQIICSDTALLLALHRFFDTIAGDLDADFSALLDDLPLKVASGSPFATEADLTETVRREMLAALHGLALQMLPARGTA
jgi:hypothetical protein